MSIEHVLSGEGAPTSAPPSLAAHYIDLASGQVWDAHGLASAEDWRLRAGTRAEKLGVSGGDSSYTVPAGVSHLRIYAIRSPDTLTVNIDRSVAGTHTGFEPGAFVSSMDVEIIQGCSGGIGNQVIAGVGANQANLIGGAMLGATVFDDRVRIPSRSSPWRALLRVVLAESELSIYLLAFEEYA